jgi:LPS-assembly protein
LQFAAHGHRRSSGDSDDADPDGLTNGRDVVRARIRADWRRDWISDKGLVFGVLGEVTTDLYRIDDVDSDYGGTHNRSHGAFAAEVRANLGLNYLRRDPAGWTLGVALGRVLRARDLTQFTAGSGLDGRNSNWLAAWQVTHAGGTQLTSRLLLDDGFGLTKAEMLLAYDQPRFGLEAGLLYHKEDEAEGRTLDTREVVFDGRVALGQGGWQAQLSNRYDLEAKRASNAGLGLLFRNECLSVDLSLSRRFTSSTSVRPVTDLSVSLELLGFGGSTEPGPSRQCRE